MSARTLFAVFAFLFFALLVDSCSFGGLFASQQPSPTPTRTRRPTATATAEDTSTPTDTATATAASTATLSDAPPTATDTEAAPAVEPTNTRAPVASGPTNTPRPRPPTATFTPKPPPPATNTPALAFQITFNWINTGRPFNLNNECSFVNGTHIEGKVYRADGTLLTNARNSAAMHLSIQEAGKAPYAYPGDYKQFPTENDGRWNAEFPKWGSDFHWKIFISPTLSDTAISYDLTGVASAASKCGQPGTANWFTADWVVH